MWEGFVKNDYDEKYRELSIWHFPYPFILTDNFVITFKEYVQSLSHLNRKIEIISIVTAIGARTDLTYEQRGDILESMVQTYPYDLLETFFLNIRNFFLIKCSGSTDASSSVLIKIVERLFGRSDLTLNVKTDLIGKISKYYNPTLLANLVKGSTFIGALDNHSEILTVIVIGLFQRLKPSIELKRLVWNAIKEKYGSEVADHIKSSIKVLADAANHPLTLERFNEVTAE